MRKDEFHLRAIWDQPTVPVIIRRKGKAQQHRIRLPYLDTNRQWLRNNRRNRPVWLSKEKFWEVPEAWFDDFVERALKKHGKVYIIQPYREQEKCTPQCLTAKGHECECCCMGANHGAGNDRSWFEASEAFVTRWKSEEWACRLLTAK